MEYFISDFHFGDKGIIKYERDKFKTSEEHDEFIIKMLENKLNKDDILYCLGDFGYLEGELQERFINLNCLQKILIKGNHDVRKSEYYKERYGFYQVSPVPIFLSKRIVLSHEPIPVTDGVLNIHGHLHGSIIDKSNYWNVSCHIANYQMVSRKQADRKIMALQKDNTKFLEEWYKNLYKATEECVEKRQDMIITSRTRHIIGFKNLNYDTERRIKVNRENLIGAGVFFKDDPQKRFTVQGVSNDGNTVYGFVGNQAYEANLDEVIFEREACRGWTLI